MQNKFINIKQVNGELFENQPVYRIFNNKSGGQLGIISYYKPWKRYVFSSREECVFDIGCLKYIVGFIDEIQIK